MLFWVFICIHFHETKDELRLPIYLSIYQLSIYLYLLIQSIYPSITKRGLAKVMQLSFNFRLTRSRSKAIIHKCIWFRFNIIWSNSYIFRNSISSCFVILNSMIIVIWSVIAFGFKITSVSWIRFLFYCSFLGILSQYSNFIRRQNQDQIFIEHSVAWKIFFVCIAMMGNLNRLENHLYALLYTLFLVSCSSTFYFVINVREIFMTFLVLRN